MNGSPTATPPSPTPARKGAPIVVKADGLAAGKGVTVAMTLDEAEQRDRRPVRRRLRRGRARNA